LEKPDLSVIDVITERCAAYVFGPSYKSTHICSYNVRRTQVISQTRCPSCYL